MTYIGQRGVTHTSTGLNILFSVAPNYSLVHSAFTAALFSFGLFYCVYVFFPVTWVSKVRWNNLLPSYRIIDMPIILLHNTLRYWKRYRLPMILGNRCMVQTGCIDITTWWIIFLNNLLARLIKTILYSRNKGKIVNHEAQKYYFLRTFAHTAASQKSNGQFPLGQSVFNSEEDVLH